MATLAARWPPTTPVRERSIATTACRLTRRPRPISSACYGTTHGLSNIDSLLEIGPIDLRRHEEIALRQAVDLVRVDGGVHAAPGQAQVRMMAFGLGHRSHAVHEI